MYILVIACEEHLIFIRVAHVCCMYMYMNNNREHCTGTKRKEEKKEENEKQMTCTLYKLQVCTYSSHVATIPSKLNQLD